jgi:hypothetical protein
VSRVPPQPSGGKDQPATEELEQLEELGDDAIIAQQQGAHAPKPRAQVTEEARSIVISDHPAPGSSPPPAPALPQDPGARRDRSEKTVVIRDRRQIDELRREIEKRRPKAPAATAMPGLWVWIVVGLAAFLTGGLVALFATRQDAATAAPVPSSALPAPDLPAPAAPSSEPPSVSIDELPIEDGQKR